MKKFYILFFSIITIFLLNGCAEKDCIPDGDSCDALACTKKCCSGESHSEGKFLENKFGNYDGPAYEICGEE